LRRQLEVLQLEPALKRSMHWTAPGSAREPLELAPVSVEALASECLGHSVLPTLARVRQVESIPEPP
jgi:hypothetical protein